MRLIRPFYACRPFRMLGAMGGGSFAPASLSSFSQGFGQRETVTGGSSTREADTVTQARMLDIKVYVRTSVSGGVSLAGAGGITSATERDGF